MSNIIDLKGKKVVIPDGEPDPEIVDTLIKLLQQAKQGKIRAFAGTFVNAHNDSTTYGIMRAGYNHALVAGMAYTQHQLLVEMSKD